MGRRVSQVSRWERGEQGPSYEVLIKLHKDFSASLNWLVAGDEHEG